MDINEKNYISILLSAVILIIGAIFIREMINIFLKTNRILKELDTIKYLINNL